MGVWIPGLGATGGNDTFVGDGTNEVADGLGGNDILNGNGGADTLRGGAGVDTVSGGDGNDTLVIVAGDDTGAGDVYNGGDGFDVLAVSGIVDNFTFSFTNTFQNIEGITFVYDGSAENSIFYELGSSVALSLVITGSANIAADAVTFLIIDAGDFNLDASGLTFSNWESLTDPFSTENTDFINLGGNEGANTITGSSATDRLEGALGADILYGGGGNDRLWGTYDTASDGAVDLMYGGTGDDRYFVFEANDTVIEFSGEGAADEVIAGIDYTLTANVEILSFLGSGGFIGVGNGLNNTINGAGDGDTLSGLGGNDTIDGSDGGDTLFGGEGNDVLDGNTGIDAMTGGNGDDTFIVDESGDTTIEGSALGGTDLVESSVTRTLTANIENLTLTGGAAITGSGNALNNVITGNGAANSLYGFDGDDTLNGAGGADSMFGGNGDDTYYVDNTGDVTSEVSALGGTDTVFSSVNRNLTANIENLTLTGAVALTGAGNSLDNVITGNSGANTLYGFDGGDYLDGGVGADTLFGANGNDTYVVDNINDIVVEGSPSGGIDTVLSSIDRNLNANFENLTLTGTAQFGYGNVLDNTMTGNASSNTLYGFDGADYLYGGAGIDFMFGGNGNDIYVVDDASDVTSEASPSGGVDTVYSTVTRNLTANIENLELYGTADITGAGNALNNEIRGNAGNNTLYGLDGNDRLDGFLGNDMLQGGAGADTYVFSTLFNPLTGADSIDTVVGFSVVDDTIELLNIFSALPPGTLAASAFRIGAAAADADDRIIYNSSTGALYYDIDGSGSITAIQLAWLAPGLALTNEDFFVNFTT